MNRRSPIRHCEERSDAAIHEYRGTQTWIATAFGLAMTNVGVSRVGVAHRELGEFMVHVCAKASTTAMFTVRRAIQAEASIVSATMAAMVIRYIRGSIVMFSG